MTLNFLVPNEFLTLACITHISIFLVLGGEWSTASAESWAERLGFPPHRKVVILLATEAGLCWETNSVVWREKVRWRCFGLAIFLNEAAAKLIWKISLFSFRVGFALL